MVTSSPAATWRPVRTHTRPLASTLADAFGAHAWLCQPSRAESAQPTCEDRAEIRCEVRRRCAAEGRGRGARGRDVEKMWPRCGRGGAHLTAVAHDLASVGAYREDERAHRRRRHTCQTREHAHLTRGGQRCTCQRVRRGRAGGRCRAQEGGAAPVRRAQRTHCAGENRGALRAPCCPRSPSRRRATRARSAAACVSATPRDHGEIERSAMARSRSTQARSRDLGARLRCRHASRHPAVR